MLPSGNATRARIGSTLESARELTLLPGTSRPELSLPRRREMEDGLCSGALVDLVKAFERVPYWLLVQKAVELGYPLWLLRLSIATYTMRRVLRVGTVYSKLLVALRGITAGSGLATTEMRLCMLRRVEKALTLHRTVVSTLFVDDLSAECTGPDHAIIGELVPFITTIAKSVEADGMELSRKRNRYARRVLTGWERSLRRLGHRGASRISGTSNLSE